MRVPLALVLLLAPALAGCAGEAPRTEDDAPTLRMLALDGRWPFSAELASAMLARANASPPLGALWLGEAMGARAVADFAALDADAARTLGVDAPVAGDAHVTRAWAAREGAENGSALTLRSYAFPSPYVATYFEMERVQTCERRPEAKICFLAPERIGEARLRLRVDEGARDAAFLPDLVEIGPNARPVWWNGSFDGPDGTTLPFSAHAPLEGDLSAAELEGEMAAGEWIVRFTLETRNGLAPAGAAGIVRIREPGYLWFDDRLQLHPTPFEQARAVLDAGRATSASVRVARVVDELPLGADVLLARDDGLALVGDDRVTALLVEQTDAEAREVEQSGGPDSMTVALRARPLPRVPALAPAEGDLVFAAPADLDLAALAPVDGARAPALALAGRPPLGEATRHDGEPTHPRLLLLAQAEGAVPWSLPEGARWTDPHDAMDNLSRSRTLALASADLLLGPVATARIELGEGNTTRSLVAIGGVEGGPSHALWTSAALVAGAGRPVLPRLLVPVEPGADREAVAERVLAAWAGVARDR